MNKLNPNPIFLFSTTVPGNRNAAHTQSFVPRNMSE